jgi:hypothetical protein
MCSLDPTGSIIETTYEGLMTPAELRAAVHATIEMVERHQAFLLLGDCARLAGGHTVVDLYELADVVRASPNGFRVKEAVLVPKGARAQNDVRFWETTCNNRGLTVKMFEDRNEAVAWLRS